MSETKTEATGPTRTFKTVNGKSYDPNAGGNLKIVRAKELAAAGITGVVAEGIFAEAIKNQFDGTDYKIEGEDGAVTIVNGFGSLNSQMAKVKPGSYVQIQYLGQETATTGKYKGKLQHRAMVLIGE